MQTRVLILVKNKTPFIPCHLVRAAKALADAAAVNNTRSRIVNEPGVLD